MKKLVLAAVCTVALVGIAMADEFGALITGIETKDGTTTVTYIKGKKNDQEGTKGTAVLAKDAKVVKGTFNKDDKKFVVGDAIPGGIKADNFKDVSADKAVNARLTIADEGDNKGKITQIMMVEKKKNNN
jgi:hypothetical protein